jgi:serine-type D-Ala-D-Ala carboxypeptidase/endopeptidase (penicillin-binding protein 4)
MTHTPRSMLRPLLILMVLAGCSRQPAVVTPAPLPSLPSQPVEPVARVWSPREEFVRFADSLVTQPMFRTALWGVLVVDPEQGDTIYAHHADKLFLPASNQKLLTGAAALSVLGGGYRFQTTVATNGLVRRGVLQGDLLVSGDGDPSISGALRGGDPLVAFDPLIAALRARGVRRIDGQIQSVQDAMPGETVGFGWEVDDLDGGSGAAFDELFFDEGVFELAVLGGAKVGAPARVRRTTLERYPPVTIRATTVPRGSLPNARRALDVRWDSTAHAVVVDGQIAVGDSQSFDLAYRHPVDAWRAAAMQAMRRAGIVVSGRTAPRRTARADTLATLLSPPLTEVLRRMEKPSQNQLAEILYRTVGRVQTGVGSADSAQRVVERLLDEWGVARDHAAVRDGSGLSRHNYVTPTALVRVLDVMRRREDFPVFYEALPIAGRDGTIASRMKGTPAEGNVRAKTGTLDKARSLSGYVTMPDGRLLLFSMLCNNWTTPVREVERVQDAIAARLAVLRLDRRE